MNSTPSRSASIAAELGQTGPLQQRSLSLPFSRIVLNPQNFVSEATEVEQNCDPTMPLGLGFYASDQAYMLPRFLSLWTSPPPAATVSPPYRLAPDRWISEGIATAESLGQALRLTLPRDTRNHIAAARCGISLDPETPILRIAVRSVVGQWVLHLSNGDAEPIMVHPGAAMPGLHLLDLSAHVTKDGRQDRELVLSVVDPGAEVIIDEFAFLPRLNTQSVGASQFATKWSTSGLNATARFGVVEAQIDDVFVDLDSVLREIALDQELPASLSLTLVVRHVVEPVHDPSRGTVTMASDGMCVVVAVPEGGPVRYFADETEILAGASGSDAPVGPVGVWVMALRPGRAVYRVGIGTSPRDVERATESAVAAAGRLSSECAAHWLGYWDRAIEQMPLPSRFELHGVDPKGLDEEAVRGAYYRSFVALYSNVLPPQPESGFHFPTIATGKASMWNHGAPGARSAAAWETFIAIQFLAYLDPETAWASFHGLMSLVDDEGSLAGESLPSRKAQTAWILFSITQDTAALQQSYPALRRLLHWSAEHPRWVYGTYDNPGEQDAEFVTSLIVDLDFAVLIARQLHLEDDVQAFREFRERLARDYERNCFIGPERRAVQHWFADDPTASIRGGAEGLALQVAMGLAVPGLTDWQIDSLAARFYERFDPDEQLAGFDFVKHPNVAYTAAGLIDRGWLREAHVLINAMLRDVILSGSFAEVYDRGSERPRPWGVRPSIFGMTQVIDSVWLNNGLRMDGGAPAAVVWPERNGEVAVRLRFGSGETEPASSTAGAL